MTQRDEKERSSQVEQNTNVFAGRRQKLVSLISTYLEPFAKARLKKERFFLENNRSKIVEEYKKLLTS
jgi:uncharacterized protein YpmS